MVTAAFFFASIGLFAQAPPSADTFAWKLTPRVNYGASPILVVDANNTTYVQFDLSSIPDGSTVSKATLVLFLDAASGSGSIDAYEVDGAWQELTLTSQNAPILGSSASGGHPVALAAANVNNFISIDVTTTVSAWLDGSLANNGLAVALVGSGGAFSFDSKESSLTSHQPQLIVQLAASGVPGPQGLQGPTGPQGPAGPVGPIGPAGAQGPAGPAGSGFNYRGAWSSANTYAIDDTVTYNGSSYIATAAVAANGNSPDQTPASWGLVAAAGATGPSGAQGPAGPTGSQGPIGLTGAAGPIGPIGPIGPAGLQGAAGPAGSGFNYRGAWSSANTYAIDDTVTYNGSSYVATAAVAANGATPDQTPASWSLMAAAGATGPAGPTGPQGPVGPQGPSGTATITLTSICSALTGSATSAALASLGCAVPSWPVGGTVSGYSSGTLILTYNGASPLTITANGAFSFGSEPTGSSYTVAIQTQPSGYACSITSGATGTVSSASASAIAVSCSALVPISFSGFQGVGGLASDGTYLWVSVEGTYNSQGQQITESALEKVDPNTGTVLASIPIGYNNQSVAFDGTNIWAVGNASASGGSGQVTLVNAATGNMTATYPVGTNPNSLAFDGTLMWICGGDGNVYALTSSGTIQYTVNVGTLSTAGQGLVRFDGAHDIYVGEPQSGAIAKIDTTSGTENGLYTVSGPYGLTVAPTGSKDLWYPNSAGNLVELQAGGGDPTLFTSTYYVGDVTSDGVDVFTYSGTTVEVVDPSTTGTVNSYSGSAISYPSKIIYDGKSNVWVVNTNATIAKLPAVSGQ